jgi:GR25 family glycosyltransferase involved in LPS biosynthesis
MALSAALSNFNIEFVDAVKGSEVPDKAIPVSKPGKQRMDDAVIGCWRSHMDAMRMVIQLNLSSVLILEDDADWDIRLKDQLRDLALASHALTQPLAQNPSSYADPTYPTPKDKSAVPDADFNFESLPATVPPKHSPYGDNWDFMWVGHCGMNFPTANTPSPEKIPKGRVVKHDLTVPQKHYLGTVSNPYDLKDQYPDHTRVVSHVAGGICSLGYAVTQAGARRLLHDIGLFNVDTPYDILLRQFCEGSEGRNYHNCLAVQPALFKHHRPAGNMAAESDITSHGTDFRGINAKYQMEYQTELECVVGRTDRF